MREADFAPFRELLDAVCSLLSRGNYTPNATNTAMFFRALADYPLDLVRRAFDAHVKDTDRGRFVPTPADLIRHLDGANDGRPGADEAWAIALRSADEADSVVWTGEIAQAWGICKPVLDAGDEVGARMAFREAYGRLVGESRRQSMPVAWSASLGHDPGRRADAIKRAVAEGRLPQSELLALPAPRGQAPSLLQIAESSAPSEATRASIRALADKLRAGVTGGVDHAAKERERIDEQKRRTAEAVQAALSAKDAQP